MEPSRRPQREPPRPSGLRYSVNAADISPLEPENEVPQQSPRGRFFDFGRKYSERIKRTIQSRGISLRPKNMSSPVSSRSLKWPIADHKRISASTDDPEIDSEQILPRAISLNSHTELLRGQTLVEAAVPSGCASLSVNKIPVPNATTGGVLPSDAEHPTKKIQGQSNWFERAKYGVFRSWETRLAEDTTVPLDDLFAVGSHFPGPDEIEKLTSSDPYPEAGKSDTTDLPQNSAQNTNEKTQNTVTGNHGISRRTTTSHSRHSNAILHQDHLATNDSKIKPPIRTLTGSTAQTSVRPSIFDRRNSSSTTNTCWELASQPSFTLPNVMSMQPCPSSASSVTSNDAPHQDLDLKDDTALSLHDGHTSALPIVDNLVSRQEASVSDQGTTSGWVNLQRRSGNNCRDQVSSDGPNDIGGDQNVTSDAILTLGAVETNAKPALSVIDEQCSDAGCSNTEVVLSKHRSTDDSSGQDHLRVPQSLPAQRTQCTQSLSEPETTEDQSCTLSEDSRPHIHTPATSATGQSHLDVPEISEVGGEDEYMSDLTDETDETAGADDSFLKAFEETSISLELLPCIIALRDEVAARVFETVSHWIRSCNSGQPTECAGSNSSTPSESNSGSKDPNESPGRGGSGKKRELDGGGPDRSGKGNGDDQGKRRKTDPISTIYGTGQLEEKLACPFWKRYPGGKLSKSCSKQGWLEVRRIKEHIYKNHMIPIHCERCIEVFDTKAELREHRRRAASCTVKTENMIGIDEETKDKLRLRKDIRGLTEIERWKKMYKILFPDAEIPSPYYNTEILENPLRTEEIVVECSGLIRQTVPQIINQTTEDILKMPETRENFRGQERLLSDIIQKAVWDVFDSALPKLEQKILSIITSRVVSSEAGMFKESTEETTQPPIETTMNTQIIQIDGAPTNQEENLSLLQFLDNDVVPFIGGSPSEWALNHELDN